MVVYKLRLAATQPHLLLILIFPHPAIAPAAAACRWQDPSSASGASVSLARASVAESLSVRSGLPARPGGAPRVRSHCRHIVSEIEAPNRFVNPI